MRHKNRPILKAEDIAATTDHSGSGYTLVLDPSPGRLAEQWASQPRPANWPSYIQPPRGIIA